MNRKENPARPVAVGRRAKCRTILNLVAILPAMIAAGGVSMSVAQESNSKVVNQAAYKPTWKSLSRYECPEWFRDAKFGIYAHWGPYSAAIGPGPTDWYSHNMYIRGTTANKYHLKTFGPVSKFGYKDLIPLFTAKKFNADAWAELYVEAGAKFAGPVAEHADGFSMWNSKVNPWNSVNMGPKRDIVGEMERAIRRHGLKFMVSLHDQWKWGWYPTMNTNTDCSNPKFTGLYGPPVPESAFGQKLKNGRIDYMSVNPRPTRVFCDEWLAKVKELVTNYQPDLLWFDSRMQILPEKYRLEMVSFYYNQARRQRRKVVLTYKRPDMELGTATCDLERARMPDIYPEPWLTDTSIARNSWAYASNLQYYSAKRIVDELVDIVSKNGCLLLDIAPAPDGTIPEVQRNILLTIGHWLHVNGEAIYGSRPWLIYGEGPTQTPVGHLADLHFDGFTSQDIRFTTKGNILYAIALGWPKEGNEIVIKSLGRSRLPEIISNVKLLGYTGQLTWTQQEVGLVIDLPSRPPRESAYAFEILR